MTMHVDDQPLGDSWSDDWKAAEAKAIAAEADSEETSETSTETETTETEEDTEAPDTEETPTVEEESETTETPAEETTTEETPAEDKPAAERPRAERMKALQAEAKSLGLNFDVKGIAVAERAAFREEKRRLKGRISEERDHFNRGMKDAASKMELEFARGKRLEAAIEANDLDEIAAAVGVKDWNALSETALKRMMSPEHKELQSLRRQRREAEEVRQSEAKDAQTSRAEEQKSQAREQYRRDLSKGIAALKDKQLAGFADDTAFVASALRYQEEEWDGEYSITVQEAAERALSDARSLYDKLHARFGHQTPSKSEKRATSAAEVTEQPGSAPTRTVSQNEVASASSNDTSDELDEDAWARKWGAKLKHSTPNV